MMPILAWTLYYADGEQVIGVTAADWEEAPAEGVLALTLWHEPPYRTHTYSAEATGANDAPYRFPGSSHVKRGITIPDKEWEAFREMLHKEPHLLEPK